MAKRATQVLECLRFINGEENISGQDWIERFKTGHANLNRRYKIDDDTQYECLSVTRWGRAPREGELKKLFPFRI